MLPRAASRSATCPSSRWTERWGNRCRAVVSLRLHTLVGESKDFPFMHVGRQVTTASTAAGVGRVWRARFVLSSSANLSTRRSASDDEDERIVPLALRREQVLPRTDLHAGSPPWDALRGAAYFNAAVRPNATASASPGDPPDPDLFVGARGGPSRCRSSERLSTPDGTVWGLHPLSDLAKAHSMASRRTGRGAAPTMGATGAASCQAVIEIAREVPDTPFRPWRDRGARRYRRAGCELGAHPRELAGP